MCWEFLTREQAEVTSVATETLLPIIDLETGDVMTDAEVIPTGEVHPVANLFPMLPDDELQELADDIRANGLQHPIVLDKDGVLIDGRNRWAACQMANVDPTFTTINGQDPVAYILSSNDARRHMNKGQRAMIRAKANSLQNKDSWGEQLESSRELSVSEARVSQSKTILKYRPDLADDVIAGTLPLNDAYAQAKARKDGKDTNDARMAILRAESPYYANEVAEERITLGQAWAAYQEKLREEEDRRKRTTEDFSRTVTALWSHLTPDNDGRYGRSVIENWDAKYNHMAANPAFAHLWTADGLRDLSDRLRDLARQVKGGKGAL
jgi:hypothetical protein